MNGVVSSEDTVVLRDEAGGLWLEEADFHRLRLTVPSAAAHTEHGQRYFPVSAIAGVKVAFDDAASSASIEAPADAFERTAVSFTGAARPPMSRSGNGAFLNYELYGQSGQYAGADLGSAYGELGLFSPLGVLTNSAVGTAGQGMHTFVRLESTFTHDFPSSLETLRLGDSVSVPGSWGGAVRFAGLQWSTNYAIRPDLVTTPLLAATGAAVLPSTVDVFVNGKAVGSSQVPAGPFVVNQVPALNGSGDVTIVVRNALGQEQLVTVPFYSAAVMLQPGLSLWDIDVGALRENFGLESNDYGAALASATWRHGFTATTTAEVHAEALHQGPAAAGFDLAQAIDHWAIITADIAVGGQPATGAGVAGPAQPSTSGIYQALGIQHVDERFNVLLQLQHASSGFRDVGELGGPSIARDRNIAQAGWNMGHRGNLQVAFVAQKNYDDTHQQTEALSYQLGIGSGSLSATVSHSTGNTHDTAAYVSYVLALGNRRTSSTSLRYDKQQPAPNTALVETLQQNPPLGNGNGYLLSAGTDGSYHAEYIQQTGVLALDAAAARYHDQSAQRLTLTGALVLLDGQLRPTRAVTDSFAMVEVGGIPNLTVYFDNHPVTRTDGNGIAVVRDLRSFDVNQLSIDPLELPLDASLTAPQVITVPPYRSGTVVRFPIKRVHPGVFKLHLADGTAVPAGAVVRLLGEEYPVGYEGLTYVTNYDHGTSGEARWGAVHCKFRLPPPPSGEAQPDLGVILCRSAP